MNAGSMLYTCELYGLSHSARVSIRSTDCLLVGDKIPNRKYYFLKIDFAVWFGRVLRLGSWRGLAVAKPMIFNWSERSDNHIGTEIRP